MLSYNVLHYVNSIYDVYESEGRMIYYSLLYSLYFTIPFLFFKIYWLIYLLYLFEFNIGHGKFTSKESNIIYTGGFEQGVKHGAGHMAFLTTGDSMTGTWRDGVIDGPVTYVFAHNSPWNDKEY